MRIHEKPCRSALNPSRIPGFDYCINPYAGCSHGCVYCYVQFTQRLPKPAGIWGLSVQVKTNVADRLARQVAGKRGTVLLSSVTDPYQKIEDEYALTRLCLEILCRSELAVSILTKSDLLLRDLKLLARIPRLTVGMTITVADDRTAQFLEPGAPSPSRRFKALTRLHSAGINTWVFIAPVIPGLGDTRENLQAILAKSRAAGVKKVSFDPLNFYPGAVARLRSAILKNQPEKLSAFERASRSPDTYRRHIYHLAHELWPRYGFTP